MNSISVESFNKIINNQFKKFPFQDDPRYQFRLRYELLEIETQNCCDYFIELVRQRKKFPNENNLLVPVLLGICNEYNIEEMPKTKTNEFPDVDVDFLADVRDYLKNEFTPSQYKAENTCSIGTYGRYALKSAMIDMARIYGYDRQEVLNITTNLRMKDEDGDELTYEEALEMYPELKSYMDKYPELALAVQKLLHRVRNTGKHAGGVIVAKDEINKFVPLMKTTGGDQLVSQFVEGLATQELGPIGLVKFDLLVVSALEQAGHAAKMIKDRHGIKVICGTNHDWDKTDYLNDDKAISYANEADLIGIFQYDSNGIREVVKASGINSFDDLVAIVSLYRPGPLNAEMDQVFIKRKTGQEEYVIHPVLDPILKSTYGVLVYQEQVMRLLNVVGKIPLKDCEAIRKAISKKKVSTFVKYKEQFIENGMSVLGTIREEVTEIWKNLEFFSAYGFNRTLTEDTIIYCVDGTKQIKDICAGDKVYCVNEKGEQAQTEVVAVHDHGVVDVVEVTFDDGYSVKCTPDHKFLTKNGQIPLWQIVRDNVDVLSSPMGDLNAKEKSNESNLWSVISKYKKSCKSSKELSKVRRNISSRKNRKVQSQIFLREEVPQKTKISRAFESLSGLHLFEMERDGEEAYISMRDRVSTKQNVGRPSSNLQAMHRNQKEKHQGSNGQIKQGQFSTREKGDIFRNSQENFIEERCARSKSIAIEKMERQESREVFRVNFESAKVSKKISNGNLGSKQTKLGTFICPLWTKTKICGSGKRQYLDRSGWMFSFLGNKIKKQQKTSQFQKCSRKRSHVERRSHSEKKHNSFQAESFDFSSENWRNVSRVVHTVPKYATITNTGSLVSRRVLRVVPVGKRQCYDLEVAVPTHNFILPNGVITSNSHAVSYTFISSRQLYLKAYYPLEFFTALLMLEANEEKKRIYITDAQNHGIEVRVVDLNKSKANFSIHDNAIYIGFGNIKGIGMDTANKIVALQPFKDVDDFLRRFGTDSSVLKALIPLKVFGEDIKKAYNYWQSFMSKNKKVIDKNKRSNKSYLELKKTVLSLLPEKYWNLDLSEELFTILKSIHDSADVNKLYKKWIRINSKEEAKIEISYEDFDDDDMVIEDKEVLLELNDICVAERKHYGFQFTCRLKMMKMYNDNCTFDRVISSHAMGATKHMVQVEVLDVNKRYSKSGKPYCQLVAMDSNFRVERINVWEDDYSVFKHLLEVNKCLSMQVKPPSNGFSTYSLNSPPKHRRHLLPSSEMDFRIVLID